MPIDRSPATAPRSINGNKRSALPRIAILVALEMCGAACIDSNPAVGGGGAGGQGGQDSVPTDAAAGTGGASIPPAVTGGIDAGDERSIGSGNGDVGMIEQPDSGPGPTVDAPVMAGGDPLPPRPLNVTAPKAAYHHSFKASEADPTVQFNDNGQVAAVDTRSAKMMGKLVLPFGGLGSTAGSIGGTGDFCVKRGFHVLGIAAYEAYDILINDAAFYGDARKEVFVGMDITHTGAFKNIHMTPADGVAQRTQKALQYLQKNFPQEDWGYFLQEDGSVRWSDVIFTGFSHGASNAARFAMLVRAGGAVSMSGPRDNMCQNLNPANCGGVVAKWFDEIPLTPIDRFIAFTGVGDGQHTQHLFAMQKLGYTGAPVNIVGAAPPYGGSHRLVTNGGHEDQCGNAQFRDACNYAFHVLPENQAGVP